MGRFRLAGLSAAFVGCLALGCGSDGAASGDAHPGLQGTVFAQPFTPRDILLVHPQTWKSADPGSTAILISDTPNLCAQITSGKTTSPGRLVTISLEKTGADGSVVDLDLGSFEAQNQGAASSNYGEVFVSGVDAQCSFSKLFSDRSSIQITQVGDHSTNVSASIDVHFTNGDSLQGSVSASLGCDELSVDKYLNSNPRCG